MTLFPPAPSSRDRGAVSFGDILCRAPVALVVESRATAREKDDDGSQETADRGDQDSPGGGAPLGAAAVVRLVDLGLDDAEGDEVGDEHDERDDEG